MSVQLEERIMNILNSQPRYEDIHDSFQRQLNARQSLGADKIPDLMRALTAVRHDHDAIEIMLATFAMSVQDAIV